MEAVAAVSSVAGLISLIIQITSLSSRYVSSMRSSSKTIKGYFDELETLNYVLRRYKELLTEPRTAQHAAGAVYADVLDNFKGELERLRSRLQKRSGENAFASSIQRLAWPIVEDKTRQLVETLARYRGAIVAMLGPDHFSLSVRIHDAVEKVQNSIDTMQYQNIVAWLDPLDQNYNQDIARGRHQHNTGDWILDCEPFLAWMQGTPRHFWIRGRPGTGKTILCSTIIDHLETNDTEKEATVYFYFDFSDHERQSVQAALRSLLSQMAIKLRIPAQQVETIYRDAGTSTSTRLATTKGLLGAFKEIAKKFSKVRVVLDGIDETSERLELLDIVAQICQEGSGNVRFLITSRPQRSVEDALGIENVVAVSLDENHFVQSDIARYVRSFLDRDPRLKRRPTAVKASIEESLVGKSGGV
jgi:Cdc6-like AAA superfamily ATPase